MSDIPFDKMMPGSLNLDLYGMDPNPYDWGTLLAPFSPPLPREGKVIMASYFGDVFVMDPDGGIWWVNGIEERVDRAALTLEQFRQRVINEHLVMLKARFIDSLVVGDRMLKPGMMYGLKTPRSEGGQYHVDNFGAAKVEDAFGYMGSRFLARNAPEPDPLGLKSVKITTDKKSGLWGKKK